jgi:hypothetical protein
MLSSKDVQSLKIHDFWGIWFQGTSLDVFLVIFGGVLDSKTKHFAAEGYQKLHVDPSWIFITFWYNFGLHFETKITPKCHFDSPWAAWEAILPLFWGT